MKGPPEGEEGAYDGRVKATIDHRAYMPAAWRVDDYGEDEDEGPELDLAALRKHRLEFAKGAKAGELNLGGDGRWVAGMVAWWRGWMVYLYCALGSDETEESSKRLEPAGRQMPGHPHPPPSHTHSLIHAPPPGPWTTTSSSTPCWRRRRASGARRSRRAGRKRRHGRGAAWGDGGADRSRPLVLGWRRLVGDDLAGCVCSWLICLCALLRAAFFWRSVGCKSYPLLDWQSPPSDTEQPDQDKSGWLQET